MLNQYRKYSYLTQNFQLSKLPFYNKQQIIYIKNIELQAGHFKLSQIFIEHSLMFVNISGQLPIMQLFQHGKRLRNTILLKSFVPSKRKK
jgi:hypothetical protein